MTTFLVGLVTLGGFLLGIGIVVFALVHLVPGTDMQDLIHLQASRDEEGETG